VQITWHYAKRALQAGATLLVGLSSASGVWAQCTDTFATFGNNIPAPGQTRPVQELLPLGRGSSLSALTATINTVNTTFLTSTSAFVSAPGNPEPDQQGGGVWARGVGGSVTSKTSSTGTLDGIVVDAGRQTCHTTVRQDYEGFQVGHDISVLNGGGTGANWHFGVTAGAVQARTKDITPGGAYTSPNNGIAFVTAPGSFSETSQIPFVGFYTAFTKGSLFLDAQVRWDFYQNSLTDPNNGLASQRLDALGFSITANAGYNIALHNNWFIEPSAGVVASRVTVDPLTMGGVLQAAGNFPYARGTVTVDDIDSVLGRASVRVGTTFTTGHVAWQPYFTASVFHEFAGDVTARSLEAGTGNANIDGLTLTSVSKGGVGTYGQFALGTAAVLGNSGWLGYGRVDYRTGENIEGWSVTGGLRYQFTPGPSGRSIKDGRAPAIYAYNWTGPYLGAYVGTQWGDQSWSFNNGAGPTASTDFAGTIVGGQAGYNIQIGRTVLGIEGEYGGSNARGGEGGASCPNVPVIAATTFPFYTCEAEVNRLAALTGRLGYTWGRALFYAKGGVAAGEVAAAKVPSTPSPTAFGVPVVPVPLAAAVSESNWQVGWTAGVGMEFALTDRWSAKAEYSHYELGRDSFTTFVGDPGTRVDTRGDNVRIGINLHLHPVQREVPLK
jgi:opacity protein-like surface antigen